MKKQKSRVMKDKVVTFHYTLRNERGEVVESSAEGEPLVYLHGRRHIVEGLEKALNGKKEGESISVTVPPELGYGLRSEDKIITLEKGQFPEGATLEVGATIALSNGQHRIPAVVKEMTEDKVIVDANHPMAEKVLVFDVDIVSIRSATKEELKHGHAHAHGSCSH